MLTLPTLWGAWRAVCAAEQDSAYPWAWDISATRARSCMLASMASLVGRPASVSISNGARHFANRAPSA